MKASFGPAPEGVPASWLVHITVADLAASRAKVEQLGGRVLMPEIAIAYGTFAVCADPLGAAFAIFQGAEG